MRSSFTDKSYLTLTLFLQVAEEQPNWTASIWNILQSIQATEVVSVCFLNCLLLIIEITITILWKQPCM